MEIGPRHCAVMFRSCDGHDFRYLGKLCSLSHESRMGIQEQGYRQCGENSQLENLGFDTIYYCGCRCKHLLPYQLLAIGRTDPVQS